MSGGFGGGGGKIGSILVGKLCWGCTGISNLCLGTDIPGGGIGVMCYGGIGICLFVVLAIVISYFTSAITHCKNINLLLYLAASGMDTTYDLGVISPGVDISVAGCYRLILGIFCSHTDCYRKP